MRLVTPASATTLGEPVPSRRRCIRLDASVATTLRWPVRNEAGEAVALDNPCGVQLQEPLGVKLMAAEAIAQTPAYACDGSVVDTAAGVAEVVLPALPPGIYDAELGIFDSVDPVNPAFVERLTLVVTRSLFNASTGQVGPPSLDQLRIKLRDSGVAENRLFVERESDDAELAEALRTVVEAWNEALPPICPHTTTTFPYRAQWMAAAKAQLQLMQAAWFRKNHIDYAAGGVSVDDTRKAAEYEQLARQGWAEYLQWAAQTKVALNYRRGGAHVGGPASWAWHGDYPY